MSKLQSPSNDDLGFLQELLTTQPPTSSGIYRAKKLRSIHEQRSLALRGYRFKTTIDRILGPIERLLMLAMVGFFIFWLYNGYVRDWIYQLQQPPKPDVAWEQIQPGASAAELDQALGNNLPYIASPSRVSLAPAPDYLVPAQSFDLVAAPTPQPVALNPLRMIVPAIQLDSSFKKVFLENGVWQVADYAVGYHHGTAFPGQGNTVTAGHAGFRGGVFARLGELKINDDIYVDTDQTRFHYQVKRVFSVWPNQVEVMHPTEHAQLTMITCTAWDTQRLIVIAELIDQAPLSSQVGGGESRGSP